MRVGWDGGSNGAPAEDLVTGPFRGGEGKPQVGEVALPDQGGDVNVVVRSQEQRLPGSRRAQAGEPARGVRIRGLACARATSRGRTDLVGLAHRLDGVEEGRVDGPGKPRAGAVTGTDSEQVVQPAIRGDPGRELGVGQARARILVRPVDEGPDPGNGERLRPALSCAAGGLGRPVRQWHRIAGCCEGGIADLNGERVDAEAAQPELADRQLDREPPGPAAA